MLLTQHFGRRHQGGLIARATGHHNCMKRHNGLATAHITLKQSIHTSRSTHILKNLMNDSFLRWGQRKRQDLLESLKPRILNRKGNARGCLHLTMPLHGESQLQKQQFLKG